jgi:hypothetical protein
MALVMVRIAFMLTVGIIVIAVIPMVRVPVTLVIVVPFIVARVGETLMAVTGGGVRVRIRVRIIPFLIVVVIELPLDRTVELGIGEIISCSPEDILEFVRGVVWVVRLHGKDTTGQDLPVLMMKAFEELGITRLI